MIKTCKNVNVIVNNCPSIDNYLSMISISEAKRHTVLKIIFLFCLPGMPEYRCCSFFYKKDDVVVNEGKCFFSLLGFAY